MYIRMYIVCGIKHYIRVNVVLHIVLECIAVYIHVTLCNRIFIKGHNMVSYRNMVFYSKE